jgi:iron complex outermembrane receptor protein
MLKNFYNKSLFYLTFFTILHLVLVHPGFAKDDNQTVLSDTVLFELSPITITATRFPAAQNDISVALTSVDKITLQSARRQLSLKESMAGVPGLMAMNEHNFAQDLRLSIRGFGARASFGIRGIKILIDGIPETTPDGQTQLDNLNIGIIDRAEIVRGAVSALYGNASGGVINLFSQKPPYHPFLQTRLAAGSFGLINMYLKAGQNLGAFNYLLSASHGRIDGYRDHSVMKNYIINGIFGFRPDSLSEITLRLDWQESPQAEDPGSLNGIQVAENPQQASSNNLLFNAGESILQGRGGLFYRRRFNNRHEVQALFYFTRRHFDNRLPFLDGGMVNLKRNFAGTRLVYLNTLDIFGFHSRLACGLELADQQDHRKRYNNLNGDQGEPVFNQNENYRNAGLFLQQEIKLSEKWQTQIGLRYDLVKVEAEDLYKEDGDPSGKRDFQGISGSLGLLYRLSETFNLYGNISTGFETPALIELSSNPTDSGGLNEHLNSQLAINYEVGIKGTISSRFRLEAALFSIDVKDEIIPYEIDGQPGRTYYRNAGKSRHSGIELGLNGNLGHGLTIVLTYTFSEFKFIDYITPAGIFDGNTIPGIPRHMFYGELFYLHPAGFFNRIEIQGRGDIFLNDANTEKENSHILLKISGGYRIRFAGWYLEPFLGLNNLFSAVYSDNLRINAFGGRYFEPAPDFNIYGGITFHIGD